MLEVRAQHASLTELVSRFEVAIPRALAAAPAHAAPPQTVVTTLPRELKTVRESRATWARLSVDRQLSEAMKQGPQNAGPINSHMLVLRSLALMQDISPGYLSHIVSYVDTLLALNPGEKELPVKRKKATPTKTAKPIKASRK